MVEIKKIDLKDMWDEVYEIVADFQDLCDEDLVDVREDILDRAEAVLYVLSDYIKEDVMR